MSDTENKREEPKRNAPVDEVRDGAIRSAIFQNDGENGPFYTATLEKRWRDDEGNWHSTNRFSEKKRCVPEKFCAGRIK